MTVALVVIRKWKMKNIEESKVMMKFAESVSHDSSSLLSEDQLLCPICVDVFTDPVTTPCGHNFCKSCLTLCWDKDQHCHCPLCNQIFTKRPELKINTTLSAEVADHVKKKSANFLLHFQSYIVHSEHHGITTN
ncbi:E3 ubiquitin-protein ligase TRIM8-like [Tachysurus vachellii]|uniref:E3 ubiquitin-protein ligase TRIM8-like n=1 Tax=Tachysurus vachellii TaxID=175792 RepID=UPI00296B43CC|nr:E3 ubiquitin-protein ligase TRIM8-like [Tachysurus vachellii]